MLLMCFTREASACERSLCEVIGDNKEPLLGLFRNLYREGKSSLIKKACALGLGP